MIKSDVVASPSSTCSYHEEETTVSWRAISINFAVVRGEAKKYLVGFCEYNTFECQRVPLEEFGRCSRRVRYSAKKHARNLHRITGDLVVPVMRVGANESSSMSGTFSGEERDVRMGRRSEDLLDGGGSDKTQDPARLLSGYILSRLGSAPVTHDRRVTLLFFMSSPPSAIVPQPAPALNLPVEILSVVFVEVVEPRSADWLDIINRRRNLLYVCRDWRAVAAGLPLLWSRLYFALSVLPDFLRECLRKAGQTADLFVEINPHPFQVIYDNGPLRELKIPSFEDFLTKSVELLRGVFPHTDKTPSLRGDGAGEPVPGGTPVLSPSYGQQLLRGYGTSDAPCLSPMWTSPTLYDCLASLTLHDFHGLNWHHLRGVLHGNRTLSQFADVGSLLQQLFPNIWRRGHAERDPAVLDVPHDMGSFFRSATNIWLDAWGFRGNELAVVVALCMNARVLDLRECRPSVFTALQSLAAVPSFSLPRLELLKITGPLSTEEASQLVQSPFPEDLVVSEWVLGNSGPSEVKNWIFFDYSAFGEGIYDVWKEPPLSCLQLRRVRILEGRPYDEHWRAVLATIDVVSLYRLALTSRALFSVVMAHVRASQPPSGTSEENLVGGPSDSLSGLPVELFRLILPCLKLADRMALSRTSRKFGALVTRELQAGVNRILVRFGLCPAEIRASLISWIIPLALTTWSFARHERPIILFCVFSTFATGYDGFEKFLNNLNYPEGFDDSMKFAASNENTDHLFGAITHYGAWFGYPRTSMASVTMPNRECIDFEDPETEDRLLACSDHFESHFSLRFHLDNVHRCGFSWECPMTARSTADRGCLSLFFSSLPMGSTERPDTAYPTVSAMSWSLGGRVCPLGGMHLLRKEGVDELRRRRKMEIDSGSLSEKNLKIEALADRFFYYPYMLYKSGARHPVLSIHVCVFLCQRLATDALKRSKSFLANAVHGADIAATRDGSLKGASFWSFKRCEDFAVNRECPWRFSVRPYTGAIFGRAELVEHHGAPMETDWFSPTFAGVSYPAIEGCFYVSIVAWVGAGITLGSGDYLELDVSFRFSKSDTSQWGTKTLHRTTPITVADVYRLSPHDLDVKSPDYVCDRDPKLGCPMCQYTPSPLIYSYRYFQYVEGETRSLAFIRYPDDLVATRDRASARGSRFSFKDLTASSVASICGARYSLADRNAFNVIFSAKCVSMLPMKDKNSVAVQLGCPEDASCAVVDIWKGQLRALREIIERDTADALKWQPNFRMAYVRVRGFASLPYVDEEYRTKDTFWVNFVAKITNHYSEVGHMYDDLLVMLREGRIVDTVVWFQRFDIARNNRDAMGLHYYLVARRVRSLADSEFPRKGVSTREGVSGCVSGTFAATQPPHRSECQGMVISPLPVPVSYHHVVTRPVRPTVADSTVDQDFAPTRDRSERSTSVFSYKSVRDENDATPFARGGLEPHVPSLFGEIDRVALRNTIIWSESDLEDGVKCSWFENESMGMVFEDGCIYIRYTGNELMGRDIDDVEMGSLVGTWVVMERRELEGVGKLCREYKLLANFLVLLRTSADEVKGAGPPVTHPTSPVMLSRMCSYGHRTVALALYDFDFAAVRQCSVSRGSRYSFKALPELDTEVDVECKEFQWDYVGNVFGEVAFAYDSNSQMTVVHLRCPAGVSCALVDMWNMQVSALRHVVESDTIQWGGVITKSFLENDGIPSGSESNSNPTEVVVRTRLVQGFAEKLEIGSLVACKVTLNRFHKNESSRDNLERTVYERDFSAVATACTLAKAPVAAVNLCGGARTLSSSVTMLANLKASRVSLAKTVYNRDFFAVRERTDGFESVYDFKSNISAEIELHCEERKLLPEFRTLAFGEIRQVHSVLMATRGLKDDQTYYIRLGPPTNATCKSINLYRKQLGTLRNIIDADELTLPGKVVDCWFYVVREDICLHPKKGHFYIVIRPTTEGESAAVKELYDVPEVVGKILCCKLVLERRDHHPAGGVVKGYELAVVESTLYDPDEIPRHLEQAGRLALTAVEYGVDFAAVRESSGKTGCNFCFLEDDPLLPGWEHQPRRMSRINILVGEVDWVSEPRWCYFEVSCQVICLRVRAPSNSACEGKRVYGEQLRGLRGILDADSDLDGNVGDSWLDLSACFDGCGPKDDCFYVLFRHCRAERSDRVRSLIAGEGIAFCCTMKRLDKNVGKTRNYCMWALDFQKGDFLFPTSIGGCGTQPCGGVPSVRKLVLAVA
ncbi:hypothetical protein C8F04DRAFT_1199183 [Mycena alexandri]|uniref:F-box domain-containing protein n=1 Tax=Mycena alexandri TaxID=1745969 RepID=A0AAD6WNT2_9AGAR|nr:hypothetical protein C8F04DRAFT_1199183 [Mycena alexandri]